MLRDIGHPSRPSSSIRRVALAALTLTLLAALPLAAQPSFVGVESANNDNALGSISVNVPAGAVGDVLVAVFGIKINPSTTTPSGWTAVPGFAGFNGATCGSDQEGIACQMAVFWRIADGSETSVSVSFGNQVLRQAAGAVLRYSGADAVAPIGAAGEQNGASATTLTAPSINTTQANSRILRLVVAEGQDAESLPLTPPATQRYSLGSFTPFVSGNSKIEESVVIAGSDATQGAAGATGTASWTLPSPGDEYVAATIEVIGPLAVQDTDLAVAKEDSPDKVNPNGSLAYTVTVSNNGPNDVTGATVTDTFDGASLANCSWTCAAAGASACGNAAGSGDINETVDVAVGDDVTFSISCDVTASPADPIGNTAEVSVPDGFNDTDASNDSDSTSTDVNEPPVAICQDVTVDADQVNCLGQADASDVDNGSNDPDGDDPITLDLSPAGPYVLGDTAVTLTVTDALGLEDSCSATITVEDNAAPVISCNDSGTIVPPDAPIAFTASATDACSVPTVEILSYDCYKFTKKGKRIDKTESCAVSIVGDTVTITDSGGVGTTIEWLVRATDGAGNSIDMTCDVEVVNPGQS